MYPNNFNGFLKILDTAGVLVGNLGLQNVPQVLYGVEIWTVDWQSINQSNLFLRYGFSEIITINNYVCYKSIFTLKSLITQPTSI